MTTAFPDLESPFFTFRIGKDATQMYAHSQAIAKLSMPLNNMINGPFLEKEQRVVVWEHITKETFTRLCEFAYCGDYASPQPSRDPRRAKIKVPQIQPGAELQDRAVAARPDPETQALETSSFDRHESVPVDEPIHESFAADPLPDEELVAEASPVDEPHERLAIDPEAEEKTTQIMSESHKFEGVRLFVDSRDRRSHTMFRDAFEARCPCELDSTPPAERYKVRSNRKSENFESVLLAHAQLYAFASEKCITSLQKLCLKKVHIILRDFTVTRHTMEDLINLIGYVYNNEILGEQDELRDMIAEVIAWRVTKDNVGGREYFMDMLEQGGAFARDFWKYIFWRRIAKDAIV